MNNLFSLLLCAGLFLMVGSSYRGNDLFQVISSHPHDVEELSPYVETVHQSGRLWIVQLKKNAPDSVLSHLRTLSGREKNYLYEGLYVTNKSRKANRVSIQSFTRAVDLQNIQTDVEELAAYETRYVGTLENQQALEKSAARLQGMGYKIQEICYREICSLIAERKGLVNPESVIMIMGHIDSVGEAFAGADDNASGTAVLLEMARVLKDYQNQKTIRFFITNGEEVGLVGSTHYARRLQDTQELKKIKLVINMDMVGYNSNGLVEIETNPEFDELARWLADLASKFTSLKTKITLGAWGSDHLPFLNRGVPALLTIEDWDTKNPCYHQECDTADKINYEYAGEIAKLNISAVIAKDLDQ